MQISECGEDVAQWLEEKLLISLRSTNVQAQNTNFALAARQSEEQIVGGLVASTSYGWLLVKVLWVEKGCRRSGIGRALIQQAESSALSRGCHSAWLDTSSADAYHFYLSLGFASFGELHNDNDQKPTGHKRWFLKKRLDSCG